MPSKTSFFNRAIFTGNYKRFWILPAVTAAFLLVCFPRVLNDNLYHSLSGSQNGDHFFTMFASAATFGTVFIAIAAIMAVWATYNWMFGGASSVFYFSAPVKRSGLFVTNYLSGLSMLIMPILVTFLVLLGMAAASGVPSAIADVCAWLGTMLAVSVGFFSIGLLCAVCTGHVIAFFGYYFVINFIYAFYATQADLKLGQLVYGFSGSVGGASYFWLSPMMWIPMKASRFLFTLENAPPVTAYLIIFTAVGILLSALSLLIFRARHAEVSGDIVSTRVLRPVFKYSFALTFMLLAETMLTNVFGLTDRISILPISLICAAIGCFAAEVMLKKSFRIWKPALKTFAILGVVVIVSYLAIVFDVFGYEKTVPDVDEIAYASVGTLNANAEVFAAGTMPVGNADESSMTPGEFSKYFYSLEPHFPGIFAEKQNIETIVELHKLMLSQKLEGLRRSASSSTSYETPFNINYKLKNGGVITRQYRIFASSPQADDTLQIREKLFFSEEYLSKYYNPAFFANSNIISCEFVLDEPEYKSFALSNEDAATLYSAILQDVKEGRRPPVGMIDGVQHFYIGFSGGSYLRIEYTDKNADSLTPAYEGYWQISLFIDDSFTNFQNALKKVTLQLNTNAQ